MANAALTTSRAVGLFALAYIVLFFLSDLISRNQFFAGAVSLIFLPAFIRLLGVLIIGLWICVALFLAGLVLVLTGAYDLGPGHVPELVTTSAAALGGPLAAFLAARGIGLEPRLESLSPRQLLILSAACALGNSVALGSTLLLFAPQLIDWTIFTPIFVGDMIGTWLVIYLLKLLFEGFLKSRRQ